MTKVNIHEAKTHLSRLLASVERGEEVIIARSGVPIARIVPIESAPQRVLGAHAGEIVIHDDFDELPDELADAFGMRD